MQYQERYYGLSRKILWTIKKDIIQYQERYHAISRKILYNIKKGKRKIKRNKKDEINFKIISYLIEQVSLILLPTLRCMLLV